MLDPSARQVYLEQLMPPEGYSLDLALACTYSLDLITLLMAPLAMALCDVDGSEAALAQPLVLAEAVRRANSSSLILTGVNLIILSLTYHQARATCSFL